MNIRSRQSGANGKVIRLKMLVMVLAALGLMGGGILVLGSTTVFAMGAQHSTAVVPMTDVDPAGGPPIPRVDCPQDAAKNLCAAKPAHLPLTPPASPVLLRIGIDDRDPSSPAL